VHIPDGWVDLPTSAAAGVVAVSATTIAARRAARALRDRATTLPAVVAAYVLVAQLLVLPVGFGTSAHLVGTGLAALLVGPAVAIVCVAAVVVVQALVLADGGVTALGLNLINDGLVPALVTWGVFVALRPWVRRVPLAGGLAAGVGSLAAAGAATLAFVIGGTDAVPASAVAGSIGGAHLLLAVLEASLTAAILATVLRLRPDLVRAVRTERVPVTAGADR
jgi:cobalt/nickel transport system permease protein